MIAQPAEPSARERRLAEALVAVIDGCVSASSVIAEARAVLASPEAPAKEDALEARHARVREAAEAVVKADSDLCAGNPERSVAMRFLWRSIERLRAALEDK